MNKKRFLSVWLLTSMGFMNLAACGQPNSAGANAPLLGARAWPAIKGPLPADQEIENRIGQLLARMSPEEKVGQIIQAEIGYTSPEDVKKYHLGSVLNGGGTRPGNKRHASTGEWLAMADAYYNASMDVSDGGIAIPIMWGADAVHGHSNIFGATIFPHNIGLGAMRNPALVQEIGRITAREVRVTGLDWTFAPTVAVAQDDRWGRTYESYSEDPALVREYAAAVVLGLQGEPGTAEFLDAEHVIATAKHFLGDGGTRYGDDRGDTRVSEAELRDIHAPGYASAIESGVQSVMASFSSWNGKKMHGHGYLLTDVLKTRMGFDGLVIGDWSGHGQVRGCSSASCPQAINAGLDVFMAIRRWKSLYRNTLKQVKKGEITQARLDDAVRRVLRVKIRAGLFDRGLPSQRHLAGEASIIGSREHRAVARRAVRESLVLLKNKGGLLPIQPGQSILIAGDGADNIGKQVGGWSITWQGTDAVNADYPGATSIMSGLREAISSIGGSVEYDRDGDYSSRPDMAVVVYGENPYAEYQGDLETLEFEPRKKNSLALLNKFRADDIPVVSVFLSGRPLWVNPELNASNAFVAAWLPGSEGHGIADVLVADADGRPRFDFKGRLSFSWPRSPLQARLNPHHEKYAPLFELSHGLNYSDGEEGPGKLPEDVDGLLEEDSGLISLYNGRPLAPWAMYLDTDGSDPILLYGQSAKHASGAVSIRTTDMEFQEDALEVSFSGSASGQVFIGGPGLDLHEYFPAGVLSFMVNLDQLPAKDLDLQVGDKSVSLRENLAPLAGQGWQKVSIRLSCFATAPSSLNNVMEPFRLRSDGQARISFGHIRFSRDGESTIDCD
jgi:beta-glucosidase